MNERVWGNILGVVLFLYLGNWSGNSPSVHPIKENNEKILSMLEIMGTILRATRGRKDRAY